MTTLSFGIRTVLTASLVAGSLVAATASAQTLRYATGFPPGSIAADAAQDYAGKVKEYSDGELDMRVYALSLLNAAETSPGVRDGIADVGYLLNAYYPAEYPHINLINEASMQLQLIDPERMGSPAKGTYAYNGAYTEFMFKHCPECNDELKRQNQVYTANGSSSRYGLLCNKPVTEVADMSGLRMRVAGAHWSRWATEMGGSSLSLTINEIYEAMDQGIIDCNIQSAPEIINLGLTEVVTDITMTIPGGLYAAVGGASVNRDVWQGLSEDQRKAMLRAGQYLSAQIAWEYERMEAEALKQVQEQGGRLHEPSQELLDVTRAFVEKDMESIVSYYGERHGVQRAEEMLTTFRGLLDKWVDLVQDVESAEQLADLYWEEVASSVDVSKHGL
ncbi:C4-dicarboxylate TRAP transporter substrate-binding protein [uncultured Marinobacter sp.]|uniref:C4-dicarboxylate TRAP transporter substrate-binding protein n=1 Tax=uncultured Marinobacter sp. TaxID=187379 RepID=UPI0030DAFACB